MTDDQEDTTHGASFAQAVNHITSGGRAKRPTWPSDKWIAARPTTHCVLENTNIQCSLTQEDLFSSDWCLSKTKPRPQSEISQNLIERIMLSKGRAGSYSLGQSPIIVVTPVQFAAILKKYCHSALSAESWPQSLCSEYHKLFDQHSSTDYVDAPDPTEWAISKGIYRWVTLSFGFDNEQDGFSVMVVVDTALTNCYE